MLSPEPPKDVLTYYLWPLLDKWGELADLARQKAKYHKNPFRPFYRAHHFMWFGARVAECQNAPWISPEAALQTAYGFGAVFDASLSYISEIPVGSDLGPLLLDFRSPQIQSYADALDQLADSMKKEGRDIPQTAAVLATMLLPGFYETALAHYYETIEAAGFVPIPPRYLKDALFPMPAA